MILRDKNGKCIDLKVQYFIFAVITSAIVSMAVFVDDYREHLTYATELDSRLNNHIVKSKKVVQELQLNFELSQNFTKIDIIDGRIGQILDKPGRPNRSDTRRLRELRLAKERIQERQEIVQRAFSP